MSEVQPFWRAGGCVAILLLAACASPGSQARYINKCQLPSGTVLGGQTAAKYASLPGVYEGLWEGLSLQSAVVIVDVMEDGSAEVFYAWDSQFYTVGPGGCSKLSAAVADDTITLNSLNPISYKVRADGALRGHFQNRRNLLTEAGTFVRTDRHPWTVK